MDGREAVETDLVKKHLEDAAAFLGTVWRQTQENVMRAFPKNTESPIESVFLLWWSALSTARLVPEPQIELHPQYQVDIKGQRFRIDFAVLPRFEVVHVLEKWNVPLRAVGIELDGHEFHERTKEQVTYRNQRDRALLSAGWHVLHFSGSELNRSPSDCVHQASSHGLRIARELEQAIIDKGGYEDIFRP